LLIEKLDDPPQFTADDVGDEDQPQTAEAQIGFDLLPPTIDVSLLAQDREER